MNKLIFLLAIFAFVFAASGQISNQSQQINDETIYKSSEVDKPFKITKWAHPYLGGRIQECHAPGETKIKVIFHKSAKITGAEVVSLSPCRIFDEEALKAAGKFKFRPAIKNGQPVSMSATLSFSYPITH